MQISCYNGSTVLPSSYQAIAYDEAAILWYDGLYLQPHGQGKSDQFISRNQENVLVTVNYNESIYHS